MDTRERIKFRIGFSRMEKQYQWKDHVIFMGLLLGLAVWLNHGIQIKGLYMDDLYFWSCYGEQSFWNMSFLWEVPVSGFYITLQPGLKWL